LPSMGGAVVTITGSIENCVLDATGAATVLSARAGAFAATVNKMAARVDVTNLRFVFILPTPGRAEARPLQFTSFARPTTLLVDDVMTKTGSFVRLLLDAAAEDLLELAGGRRAAVVRAIFFIARGVIVEHSATDVRVVELYARYSAAEIGRRSIDDAELGPCEVGVAEVGPACIGGSQKRVDESRAAQVSVGKVAAFEVRVREVAPVKIDAFEIGARRVEASQIEAAEVRGAQVRSGEFGAARMERAEDRLREVAAVKMRSREIGAVEPSAHEVRTLEASAGEIGAAKVCVLEVRAGQPDAVQIATVEVEAAEIAAFARAEKIARANAGDEALRDPNAARANALGLRAGEGRAVQIGPDERGAAQVGPIELDVRQVVADEARAVKIGVAEVGACEVIACEDEPVQVRAAPIDVAEIAAGAVRDDVAIDGRRGVAGRRGRGDDRRSYHERDYRDDESHPRGGDAELRSAYYIGCHIVGCHIATNSIVVSAKKKADGASRRSCRKGPSRGSLCRPSEPG